MAKDDLTVRARCSEVLKKRLTDYLKSKAQQGHSIAESDVVRKALIQYLDAHESPTPSPAVVDPLAAPLPLTTLALEAAQKSVKKKNAKKRKQKGSPQSN